MKKVLYFTDENRIEKIKEWKSILDSIYSEKKPFEFNPTKTALLIVDMQNYFTDSNLSTYIPSSKTIINPIKELREKFHSMELPVIITKYGLPDTIESDNMMNNWWGGALKLSDNKADIHPMIKDDWSIVIEKSSYDSFYQTELESILQEHEIIQLVIVGLVTHLCVESTARSAFQRNYQVFLPIDCMASYTEEMHISSLRAAAHGFGIPSTSQQLMEKFR
ncbi:MAG: cysteine hydrolase [Asgard group archaeon]|nr:cysteine hydrolase [Asgard group archaeon]